MPPVPYVDRRRLTRALFNQISESLGEAIEFPDTTEVSNPSPGLIEIKITTTIGVKIFEIRVIEKRS